MATHEPLFHRRFGEVNLSKRALYFTYAGRGKIVNSDAARILVDVCYTSYTPLHFWLTVLDPESILSFMRKAFTKTSYPRVRALIRLFFAIGPGPWLDYIIKMHDRINHYSQKPNWYWFVDRLAKKIDAAEPIYVALEAEPHHTLLSKSISEFVGNQLLSDQYLSKACADFASERHVDESAVRKLDLIVHFESLARLLPPPTGMPEDLSRIDSSTHSRSSSRYISEGNRTSV